MTALMDREAGWALVQSDCHKWMNLLIAINNQCATTAYDFLAFRTAADRIVQDELRKRKNDDIPVCELSPFIFEVFRRVWLSTNAFAHPSRFPYDSPGPVRVMMAPFLVIRDLEDYVRGTDNMVVGLDDLYYYVQDNLECQYELEEFLCFGPTPPAGPPKLSYDHFLRHQAQFREATQFTRMASSPSPTITEPRAKRQKISSPHTPQTSTGHSSPAAEEHCSPAPSRPALTAGALALQELRTHFADGFQLRLDDNEDHLNAQTFDALLAMNPNAICLIKTFLDRLVDANPVWMGEMGCFVCIVMNNEEVMTTIDGLEDVFACGIHTTEERFYTFTLSRC